MVENKEDSRYFYQPKAVDELSLDLIKATEAFKYLVNCKASGAADGKYLTDDLVVSYRVLKEDCEEFFDKCNEYYIKFLNTL